MCEVEILHTSFFGSGMLFREGFIDFVDVEEAEHCDGGVGGGAHGVCYSNGGDIFIDIGCF